MMFFNNFNFYIKSIHNFSLKKNHPKFCKKWTFLDIYKLWPRSHGRGTTSMGHCKNTSTYIKKLFEVPKNIHLWATSDNSGVGGKWKEAFIFECYKNTFIVFFLPNSELSHPIIKKISDPRTHQERLVKDACLSYGYLLGSRIYREAVFTVRVASMVATSVQLGLGWWNLQKVHWNCQMCF